MLHSLLIPTGAIVGIVIAAVVVVLLIVCFIGWYISLYNKLQRLKNLVDEAWSTIDVSLKKRYDLIPNLVATVKGYAKHESETMTAVIQARNIAQNATGDDKIAAENALTSSLRTFLNVTKEAYPQLQANTNFLDLQNQLKKIEDEIASGRRYYNGAVKTMNTKIDVFPSNLVARKIGLEKRKYFELDSPEERQNVKVEF